MNALDQLIAEQQNDVVGRQAMVAPGNITVAGAPQPLLQGPFGASGTDWAQANWQRSPEQLNHDLREGLQLDVLASTAARNKFQLEQAQEQAPLQNRLLQARVDATGAHQRFLENNDAHVLEHTAGFLNHMAGPNAPSPSDPNYHNYVLGGLIKNPRFAETPGGRDILKQLTTTHDTHTSIEDLKKQVPPGFQVSDVRIGPKGPSISIKEAGSNVANTLKNKYGLRTGDFENPASIAVGDVERNGSWKGADTGAFVRITKGDGKAVTMPAAEFESLGGKYSAETLAKRNGVQGNAQAVPVVVDRIKLAQEALNDPNATRAHVEAAKKILNKP